ncbi:MAG: HIT family protein [Candidatus Pacebacteria bacterium]|nr:HIT family protein [Candidatus Paceibacterota bacterium]
MSEKTIFKKIIDGELPSYKIYEDDDFLVFLNIYPLNPGHTLVIPKQEVRWVWQVEKYDEYLKLARLVALAHQKVFNTEMIFMDVRGDEVPHAHIHIRSNLPNDGTEKNFEKIAEKIKKAL